MADVFILTPPTGGSLYTGENIGKTRKAVSEIKWWTRPASLVFTLSGQDVKKFASQPQRELFPPLRNTFLKMVSGHYFWQKTQKSFFCHIFGMERPFLVFEKRHVSAWPRILIWPN